MLCPNCKKKMIEGLVKSAGMIIFDPINGEDLDGYIDSNRSIFKSNNFIKFGRSSVFTGTNVLSYYCTQCKHVITPIIKK